MSENKQGICSNCGEDQDYLDQYDVCLYCRENEEEFYVEGFENEK